MKVTLATPERSIFSGESEDVLLVAEKGQLNILPQHANLMTFIRPGPVIIRKCSNGEQRFNVGEGVLKVETGTITILVESAEALSAAAA